MAFMNSNIVVYTALFGNYSGLIEQPKLKNVDYICYTDQDITSKSWKIIKVKPPINNDNTRSNRYYKILPHKHLKNYETSVYIDANFLIVGDFYSMILDKLKNNKLLCFDHNQTIIDKRNCIYEEYDALTKTAKIHGVYRDSIEVMKEQIDFIKSDGYPKQEGLISAGVLIRNHNDTKVIELMELWWSFVKNRSKRDQLSFNYCAWKLNFTSFEYFNGDIRSGNDWFHWIDHQLDFSKDLKKFKRKQISDKLTPNFIKVENNIILESILHLFKLPYLLIKLKTWCQRYSLDYLTEQDISKLRQKIFLTKLNKKGIINEIVTINTQKKKERLTYWNHYLDTILPKKQENLELNIAKQSDFTAMIVEARKHPHFKVVVENVILNTQHLDVCLRVYHGTENESFVKECLKEHSNIQFINLNVKNIDIEGYNKIMLSEDLYQNIASEHILVFQTDVITFKPLDKKFLKYDYIGAPWVEKLHGSYKAEVGNGGLSLRSKNAMLTIIKQNIPRECYMPEDLYLAQILKRKKFNVANYETALEFSAENVFALNTFGCHKSWEVINFDHLKKLFSQLSH
jgi:hypothetical protein